MHIVVTKMKGTLEAGYYIRLQGMDVSMTLYIQSTATLGVSVRYRYKSVAP